MEKNEILLIVFYSCRRRLVDEEYSNEAWTVVLEYELNGALYWSTLNVYTSIL